MQTTQLTVRGHRLTFGPDRRFSGGNDAELLARLNYRAETTEPFTYATHAEDANHLCADLAPTDFVTSGEPPTRYIPPVVTGFPPPPP